LKYEEVYLSEYETLLEAEASIGRFLEEVYNRKRLHSGGRVKSCGNKISASLL